MIILNYLLVAVRSSGETRNAKREVEVGMFTKGLPDAALYHHHDLQFLAFAWKCAFQSKHQKRNQTRTTEEVHILIHRYDNLEKIGKGLESSSSSTSICTAAASGSSIPRAFLNLIIVSTSLPLRFSLPGGRTEDTKLHAGENIMLKKLPNATN